MRSIWDRVNPQLRELAVYEPGKPIEETAREAGAKADEIIKLASNENPLGPSPRARAAIAEAAACTHLYPDGGCFYLREAVSTKLGLPPEWLIFGNGSNEIIEFIGHAFLGPEAEMVVSEHAFVAYKIIATVFGARTVEVPARDLSHDLPAMAKAITPRTRVVFIANPNNPTGTMLSQGEIDAFMQAVPPDVVIAIDEAYFEYVDDPPDNFRWIREGRNMVVLRTFSKIHGLAGLRLGYGAARPELIQVLQKTREPFNVNSLAQAAGLASLEDDHHVQLTKRMTDEGRAWLQGQLSNLNIPFVPSFGNFVLVNVGNADAVFREMLKQRIIVRALKGYNLPEYVRISVGTMEQNERCLSALRQILNR